MASDPVHMPKANSLYRLAAAGGAVLGVFLLMGAYGHLEGVDFLLGRSEDRALGRWFVLLLPTVVLATAGAVNLALSRALWDQAAWSLLPALTSNLMASAYLVYLMITDIPNHPVGTFLALLSTHVILLAAIRVGLVWPAVPASSE